MINKFITRKTIKDKRIGMPEDMVISLSASICDRLILTEQYLRADTVCLYISTKNEVDTLPLIRHALSHGKRVAAPRVSGSSMEFYYFYDVSDLVTGAYNILEPVGDHALDVDDALIVMPGVAFDEQCNRIGYGGGYYDRYLSTHKTCTKIALAYELQITEQLQAEQFDVKPDMVITETRVITHKESK